MLVVFEGIDGSGKTTISGRVFDLLNARGVSTFHARPKGELKSRLAKNIRTMARDPRSLTMSPHTELLLYLARDAQMIDNVIRPSLNKADVVIADRYVYSPGILCRARGLVADHEIDNATELVARGLWPDLVVYCDVDIHTSNLRKKLDKIVHLRAPEDFGRKGLRGLGLREQMRAEYLKMVDQNNSWMVIDNVGKTAEENSVAVANRILSMLGFTQLCPAPAVSEPTRMKGTRADSPSTAATRFYQYLNALCDAGYPRMALYHARSLDSEEAWSLRNRFLDSEPEVIALGLEPLGSDRAIRMRRQLIEKAPRQVALSLSARWADDDDNAWDLRRKLARIAPIETALSMSGLDSDRAFDLRTVLADDKSARGAVLLSLKRLDSESAWELRNRYNKKKYDFGLLEGLAGIDSEPAWKIRRSFKANALPWVILSLTGLDSPEAWKIRDAHVKQATKLVLRSISGLETDRAWTMRQNEGSFAKEALTTIKGSDHPMAWNLRQSMSDIWPEFVARSIGIQLATQEHGRKFLENLMARHPQDPEVAHYLVKTLEAEHGEQ